MPVFHRKQHAEIAKLLGFMPEPDELVQLLTNKFGEFFQDDNTQFNFTAFQSLVTRIREGRNPNPNKR